ncbi:S-layer homology domain-containing protein [Paenibacillus sp. XY044]|uniref:S-layer homology domain-containing protein n=1 Tax=Paenibacillus sp. XY044 TaxID=2026089 RepID=UPI00211B02CE|nr:S-layer homology domain-containing protein [Paenibacillus sp. XY044]
MIKPQKLVTLFAAFMLAVSTGPAYAAAGSSSLPFHDISGSFARDEIVDLVHEGVVEGTGGGAFEPHKTVTRAEFTAMTDRLLKLKEVDGDIPAFSDVPRTSWYYGWVQAGLNLGIVQGKSANTFEPKANITREEAAVLIVRALKEEPSAVSVGQLPYQDTASISAWARPYVKAAAALGLMEGANGKFRPKANMTREETAAVLDRVLQISSWDQAIHSTPASSLQVGWQNGLTISQFIAKVKASNINTIVPRWFFLEEGTSSLSNHVDSSLLSWAKQNNKKVWALLGNHSNAELTDDILTDSTKKSSVIKQLTSYVKKYGLSGINVDFENVSTQDREALTAFVTELDQSLRTVGGVVSIDVSPDLGTDWTEAFDYNALGQAADYMILMGYDEHWDGDPIAGSVSSYPWVESALNKLLRSVPSAKTILALPFYTRDWTLKDGGATSEELTLAQQGVRTRSVAYNRSWDDNLGQYVFKYQKQGYTHNIWIEDSRSITKKYVMAADRGVAGYAFWYMGAETPDVWTAMSNADRYASY